MLFIASSAFVLLIKRLSYLLVTGTKTIFTINFIPFRGVFLTMEPLVDAPPVNLRALANCRPVEIDVRNLSLAVVGSTKAL
jgi:hypothetical protein